MILLLLTLLTGLMLILLLFHLILHLLQLLQHPPSKLAVRSSIVVPRIGSDRIAIAANRSAKHVLRPIQPVDRFLRNLACIGAFNAFHRALEHSVSQVVRTPRKEFIVDVVCRDTLEGLGGRSMIAAAILRNTLVVDGLRRDRRRCDGNGKRHCNNHAATPSPSGRARERRWRLMPESMMSSTKAGIKNHWNLGTNCSSRTLSIDRPAMVAMS